MYSKVYIMSRIMRYLENNFLDFTYLNDADLLEVSESKLVIYSPETFRKDMILTRLSDKIKEAMREEFQYNVELVVLDKTEISQDTAEDQNDNSNNNRFHSTNTFENFVVGSNNDLAYNASLSVAEEKGKAYNPLFIYGQSGLGKTHLMNAIGNFIQKKHPEFNIMYTTGDKFTNEFIASVKDGRGKGGEFREKYCQVDLLLVDDVQFLKNKEKTQEEFFHTFDYLHTRGRQIVLTSDRPPNELTKLEDRLRTRFEWGLIVDVQPPDFETRVAIIQKKAESLALELEDDVCFYLANNLKNNVRQLEGAIKKIKACHDLQECPLDIPNITRILKDLFKEKNGVLPTPNLIISQVCYFYNIEDQVIRGNQRTKGIIEARQIAMYLVKKKTTLSLNDIGKEFNKNHTTVMHAIEAIEAKLDDPNSGIQDNIRDIESMIENKL